MTAPHQWKPTAVDAHLSNYGGIAQDFLALVVFPSLDALEQRLHSRPSTGDRMSAAFECLAHFELVSKTNRAFCLSIQALWETYLRNYLASCPNAPALKPTLSPAIESAKWGEQLNSVFLAVRGLQLDSFDSYPTLNKLQLLANVCRHGAGRSGDDLYKLSKELWPSWAHGSYKKTPPTDFIKISRELLTQFVNAIDVFWMDMERHGLESFGIGDEGVERRLATLRAERLPKLLTFNPDEAKSRDVSVV
ncbi:hypothetical protein PSH28_02845 [Pseudomonas resinovorans]|uniref:hypothetical protein n=1 Tax=Metapseudomonas resinovorans TaxID=53412 RepID=UPI00237F8852|nr:hypothetical protein [Pseudomonas resinovorans]MDE3735531.1 hypothetical protein [Pseudomonas resinovorans]